MIEPIQAIARRRFIAAPVSGPDFGELGLHYSIMAAIKSATEDPAVNVRQIGTASGKAFSPIDRRSNNDEILESRLCALRLQLDTF